MLEPLHLGMRLRCFPSGVNVIEAGKVFVWSPHSHVTLITKVDALRVLNLITHTGTPRPNTDDFSDARIGERLAQLVAEEEDGSLTALEVAGKMHVSITLAQEFLKVGVLVHIAHVAPHLSFLNRP